MPSLPDWAPNLHPLVIHFPIGLLVAAALCDFLGLFTGPRPFLRQVALLLYLIGAGATFGVYYSGIQAADSVFLPTQANALLHDHSDLGAWTMWYFASYALIRLALSFGRAVRIAGIRFILFVLGLAGVGLMAYTAHRGAELVFRHGVGIQALEHRPAVAPAAVDTASRTGGVVAGDSLWTWAPNRAAAWAPSFTWLAGTVATLDPGLVADPDRSDVLSFNVSDTVAFFVTPESFESLQVDLEMDLSEFDGNVMVAYHVRDADTYAFSSVGTSGVRLGRSENGDLLIDGTGPFDGSAWRSLRMIADSGHFRTYVDTELASHAHAPGQVAGPVGLRFNGTGRVKLGRFVITSLR